MRTRTLLGVVVLVGAMVVANPPPARADHIYWQFVKRSGSALGDSRLNLVRMYHSPTFSEEFAQWRADSGNGTAGECEVNKGWLPDGWYNFLGTWDDYNGSAIYGRVYWFNDKQCHNGTWRTQLFIHSEETPSRGQYCPTSGDDPQCWEGDVDYRSAGCIKINYNPDSGTHHSYVHSYQWGGHGQVVGYNELVVWQEA